MRRTQAERREATIARLLDATIDALAERGYAGASVAEICRRAGLSQGALFRHFDTRHAVIGAATDEIGRRHLARFVDAFPDMRAGGAVSTPAPLALSRSSGLGNVLRTPGVVRTLEPGVGTASQMAGRRALRNSRVLARTSALSPSMAA